MLGQATGPRLVLDWWHMYIQQAMPATLRRKCWGVLQGNAMQERLSKCALTSTAGRSAPRAGARRSTMLVRLRYVLVSGRPANTRFTAPLTCSRSTCAALLILVVLCVFY